MPTTGERFERAVAIMARLRAPGGCPWDREQTFDSIKPFTLEETYEVLEAIDNRDWDELSGELGDLLLQVLFYSEMSKQQGTFSIDDVLDRLSTKLVDRHPHVFGSVQAETSSEVIRNWEALKAEEKKKRLARGGGKATKPNEQTQSVLAGVSTAMPSLLEAHKLSARAAQVGFDWPNVDGLFDKLHEETEELREQLKEFPAPGPRPQYRNIAGSGKRTASSNGAFSGWKNTCAPPADLPNKPPWKNSKHYGSRRNDWKTPDREDRLDCHPQLPRSGRTAHSRDSAKGSVEFHRRRTRPLASVCGGRKGG